VTQLRRVRIDNIKLGTLKLGTWRNLTDAELKLLLPGRTDW
jgi:23S rRNA pseudouridine2604 synthase